MPNLAVRPRARVMMLLGRMRREKQSDNEFIKQVQDNGYKFKPDFAMTQGEAKEVSHGQSSIASKFTAGSDIKAHHLLVLLLRLRQICNHPG